MVKKSRLRAIFYVCYFRKANRSLLISPHFLLLNKTVYSHLIVKFMHVHNKRQTEYNEEFYNLI